MTGDITSRPPRFEPVKGLVPAVQGCRSGSRPHELAADFGKAEHRDVPLLQGRFGGPFARSQMELATALP
jgi:hypothetical protein